MSGSWLEMLDRDATLAVNNFSGAFTDAVMPVLSNRVVMIPIYLLLIWLLWRRYLSMTHSARRTARTARTSA